MAGVASAPLAAVRAEHALVLALLLGAIGLIGVRPALRHPNVTLRTRATVMRLETSPSGREVSEVVVQRGCDAAALALLGLRHLGGQGAELLRPQLGLGGPLGHADLERFVE